MTKQIVKHIFHLTPLSPIDAACLASSGEDYNS